MDHNGFSNLTERPDQEQMDTSPLTKYFARRESTGCSNEGGRQCRHSEGPVVSHDVIAKLGADAKCKISESSERKTPQQQPLQNLRLSSLHQQQLRSNVQGLRSGSPLRAAHVTAHQRRTEPACDHWRRGDKARVSRPWADQTKAVLFWHVDGAFVW